MALLQNSAMVSSGGTPWSLNGYLSTLPSKTSGSYPRPGSQQKLNTL